MKKIQSVLSKMLIAVFIVTNLFAYYPTISIAQTDNTTKVKTRFEDRSKSEIIVKYKNDVEGENVKKLVRDKLNLAKLETKRKFKKSRINVLEIDTKADINKVIKELKSDPNVEYVQPNFALETYTAPSDDRFSEQWGLYNTGQDIQGKTGRSTVDINAIPAWDLTKGTNNTLIGVLDTGIDINHNDLKDNIYVNLSEKNGVSGVDDDNNGYIDDISGWDFVNDDETVFDSSELDLHGTYVAGVIGAKADNGGISGVAPGVAILPLKFINGKQGYTCDAIAAIEYAMAKGVKIINCSFGGADNNYALMDAMRNSGILFVCAAGNQGADVASSPVYPAYFDIPNVLSVASINNTGILDPSSSFGTGIDVAAPGVDIISTTPDNTYDYLSGTSVASAHVTGIAALLKSEIPDATFSQISQRIKENVVRWIPTEGVSPYEGKLGTAVRVDAYAALTNTAPAPDISTPPEIGSEPGIPGDEYNDDSWYTMEQYSKIKEQLHYGESGVSPATGNYSFTCNDMSMSAPGFQVNISRTYNSKSDKSSPMGKGWTFGFEGKAEGTGPVTVTLPNGSVETFKKNSNGTFSAQDSRSKLEKINGTFVLTTKDQYSYGFNTNGYLIWMKDRNGNTVNIEVDTSGKVKKITDQVGRYFTVNYNTQGLIKEVIDPEQRTVKYEYNANKYLTKITDAAGNIMSYEYDSSGFITKVKDHDGNIIESITYDHASGPNQHKVKEATDSYGNKCAYVYDTTVKKTTITENGIRQWVHWFDSYFYTVKVQDPEGRIETTEYHMDGGQNKYGDVKSKTDRNGNTTYYDIDNRGNVTQITNCPGNISKEIGHAKGFEYDDRNNLIKESDEEGKLTFYIYDAEKKNLLKKVQPLNGTELYIEGTSNPDSFAITTYIYYTSGENGYLANGFLKTVTDPEGNVTTYTYDSYGNIRTVEYPKEDGETPRKTTYEYNIVGWKTAEISPKGYRTEYVYDNNGLLEKKILNAQDVNKKEITRIVYDPMGRKIQEISPKQYDPVKDGLSLANPLHTYNDNTAGYRFTYFKSGKVESATDPENNKTVYTYDVYGNVLTETKQNGAIYTYEYDVMDRLKKVSFQESATDITPDILEEYSYAVLADGKEQKTHTKHLNSQDKAVTTSIYDYAGRLVEQQNPDNTRTITYHLKNGLEDRYIDVDGSTTYYKYDGLNRLAEQWSPFDITSSGTKYAYTKTEYDKTGKKKTEKTGKDKVDKNGIPLSYVTIRYSYYRNGKVRTVTDEEGRKTEYFYDKDGNLSREDVYTSQTEKNTTEYEYNHLGKVTKKKVYVKAGDIYGYSQDTALETTYTYDRNGNTETVTTPNNVTTTYTYDSMDRQIGTSQPGIDETGSNVIITTSTTYNWEGKPETTTDANGNITTMEYNKQGDLERIKKTVTINGTLAEYVTAYYYDLAGRKIAEVFPINYDSAKPLEQMDRTEYSYDLMGRVKTKVEKFHEKSINQSTRDWISNWVEVVSKAYKYDNSGNVVKELDARGYEAGTGAIVDEKIASGYGTEYTYNLAGKLAAVRDAVSTERALPYTKKYEYDALGRKISETNAKGIITVYAYDDAGNVLSTSIKKTVNSPEKTIQTSTYDLAGNVKTQTDGNGNETVFVYNALSKVKRIIYPGDETIPSKIEIIKYDKAGNLKVMQDSTTKEEIYDYDNQGRVLSYTRQKTDGTQKITTYNWYDKNGNKRFEKDGNGITRENVYDGLNRLMSTTVAGHTTKYSYDANGNQTGITDWRGNTSINVYDAINRLIEKKYLDGVVEKTLQRMEYNHNHVQIKSYDALNYLTEYEYDRNNRLTATIDPERHSVSQKYDDVGNIQTKIDGNNIATTYYYDEFNRLKTVVNAKLETTAYTYDLNGNMLTQIDGEGHVTTFEYNAVNKPVKRIDHGGRSGSKDNYTYIDTKVESYTYDVDGNLQEKKDRNGKVTTYTYDIHGRLLSQSIDSSKISYTYDNNGNQLTMTDSTGTTSRTYDAFNRVLTKNVPNFGTSTFEYDIISGVPDGYTAETSTDPKGNITKKVYDRLGRLTEVVADGQMTTYTYYANGNRESVIYPNGARENYIYYKDNLLRTLTNKNSNGNIIETYTYTYDGAHNQISKTDSKGTTNYTYDSLNRLETVTEREGKVTSYTFDKAGNRQVEAVRIGENIVSTSNYYYDEQNRLVSTLTQSNGTTEKVSYSYDANGNMISKSKAVTQPVDPNLSASFYLIKAGESTTSDVSFYAYDVWNQLKKTIEGDKTITYVYNGDGMRVEKAANGQETRYLYEYDKVVLEVDGSGNQVAWNVQGLNTVCREVYGETSYYMYNGHGDVTALISVSGEVMATYYYDAFGNIVEQNENVYNPYRYAGYQYDSETDLYYLNARYYDSKIARFITEDTYRGSAADPLSLNLYTYCHNEPIMYTDPTGHIEAVDAQLSAKDKAKILKLTEHYYSAKTDEERNFYHQQAVAIRQAKGSGIDNYKDEYNYKAKRNTKKEDWDKIVKEAFAEGNGKSSKGVDLDKRGIDIRDNTIINEVIRKNTNVVENKTNFGVVKSYSYGSKDTNSMILTYSDAQSLGVKMTTLNGKVYYDYSNPLNKMVIDNAELCLEHRAEFDYSPFLLDGLDLVSMRQVQTLRLSGEKL